MASLTGQTISSTYDSLLKVTDNGPLNSSLRTITDGLGNSSSLQLSTIAAYITGGLTVTGQLQLGSTISNGTYTYTLPSATGTIALVGGAGVGTVTSVAAITLGTSGTDLSSTVANGTTTPVITLNVPDASATARGLITTGTQTIAGAKTFTGNSVFKNNDSGNPAVTFRNENGSGITAQWLTSANTVAGTIFNSGLISTTPQGDLYGSAINSFTSSQLAASLTDETGTGSVVFSASPTFTGVPIFGSSISNGTYTYTLPSATGTLALTSDIHSAVTLSAIGSTANANGATLTGQVLNLQPASASFGGVVTTGAQTFAGAKTFSSDIVVNGVNIGRGVGNVSSNTAIGAGALGSNTTGSLNVALGYQAGFGSLGTNSNTTGSNNIFIGYNSVGLSATASNRTWIGNAATQSTWLGGRLLIGSTTDSGNAAIQVTATTLLGLYASATTGIAVQGDSSGTGGTGVFGNSGNGYGGAFANNSTTYPALWVNNNEESAGDIAVFQWIGSSIFTVAPGISTFNTSVIGRSFIPTFSTVPTNGMYLSAANTLNFATNTTNRFSISSTGAATFSSSLLEIAATSPTLRINSTTGGNDGILAWYVNTNYIGDIRTNSSSGAMTFNQGPSPGWGGFITFQTDTIEAMRITSGGVVLVNQTALSSAGAGTKMQVATDMLTTGSLAGYFWENRSGGVTANTNWYGWYTTSGTIYLYNGSANIASINTTTGVYTPLSDINKKKDFEQSEIGLNAILGLKPTLYRMKSDDDTEQKQLGFIAQEVKEFIPQAFVETKGEDENFVGLNYNAIVAALVKSVQELKAEIDLLKGEPIIPTNNNLENK